MPIVVFRLDGERYAIPLNVAQRVVQVVEITPLPNAPAAILGVLNIHGQVVAVVDLRRRLGFPPRDLQLSDQLLFVRAAHRTVALLVDEVTGVVECLQVTQVPPAQIVPGLQDLAYVVNHPDGLVLVQDLEQLLSTVLPCDANLAAPSREVPL